MPLQITVQDIVMRHPMGMRCEKKRRYKSGVPQKNYEAMMKKSGGSPLFYLRDGKDARRFLMEDVGIPESLMRPSELDDKEYMVAWVPSPDEDVFFGPDAALNHLNGAETGRELAQKNIDFLARSIRRDQY